MTTFNLRSALLALSLASVSLIGCGEDNDNKPDASIDAGDDAGTDAGDDAGTDAGEDAGTDPEPVETGGAASSAQIKAVLDAADGALDPALAIDAVAVTYVRPAFGSDPAGFFVQAETAGPAAFVAVDPATMATAPVVGDIVSFKVSEVATASGLKQVKAISDFAKSDEGFVVESLAQNVNAVDLPATVLDYASELITLTATITNNFSSCGGPNLCAEITTEGVPAAVAGLRFRTVQDVVDANSLRAGCKIQVGPTPLWMFANAMSSTAQPSAWAAEDVTASECPAVEVDSASASSPTEVVVRFDTIIKPESVTAGAFTISSAAGPLAVTAADADGNSVVLTTGAQVGGAAYTVVVASTVTDMNGVAVAAEPGNTTTFAGFVTPAAVLINEVDANIASGCDLVELRVISGGSMDGFKFQERAATHLTFPAGFSVQANDLIVIHFDKNDTANCGGGTPAPADETAGPNTVSHPRNFPGAFDFWVTKDGLTNTNNGYTLRTGADVIVDFLLTHVSGDAAGATATAWSLAAAAGQWTVAADDNYDRFVIPDYAFTHSGVAADGSLQRNDNLDPNGPAGWVQTAPTFGALNVGQSVLP